MDYKWRKQLTITDTASTDIRSRGNALKGLVPSLKPLAQCFSRWTMTHLAFRSMPWKYDINTRKPHHS